MNARREFRRIREKGSPDALGVRPPKARRRRGRFNAVLAGAILVFLVSWGGPQIATGEEPGLLDPVSHPKFVTPVPNPLDPSFIFQPDGTLDGDPYYEVGVFQHQQDLGLFDPNGNHLTTTVWGYGKDRDSATYPGRTFVVQKDQPIDVRWTNNLVDADGVPLPHLLPVDTTLHWADPEGWPESGVPILTHVHGGHTESASDGLPEAWFTPGFAQTGPDWKKEIYHYDNDQEAGTIWYHDHALGITRLNVYAGLAGFYIIRDGTDTGLSDNPLGLPAFPYETLLAIQDRAFTADGQLFYESEPEEAGEPDPSVEPESFGDFMLVNGKAWPYMDVQPRKYRLRLVNGSDSRFLNMWITPGGTTAFGSGPIIYQIGTDDGLLYAPVPLSQLTLGPGERADLIVDFSAFAGQTLILRNNAKAPYPRGDVVDPRTTGQIMAFRVGATPVDDPSVIPSTLRPSPIMPPGPISKTRQLILFEGTDEFGRLETHLGTVTDGALDFEDPITENPVAGTTEVWEIYNTTADTHPIHLHLVSLQILSRQRFRGIVGPDGTITNIRLIGKAKPPAPNEAGWKDTVQMAPGEVTRIIMTFSREGLYVWHCHILSHEDHEMMRPYEVIAP
jgi:spore coat protein A